MFNKVHWTDIIAYLQSCNIYWRNCRIHATGTQYPFCFSNCFFLIIHLITSFFTVEKGTGSPLRYSSSMVLTLSYIFELICDEEDTGSTLFNIFFAILMMQFQYMSIHEIFTTLKNTSHNTYRESDIQIYLSYWAPNYYINIINQ